MVYLVLQHPQKKATLNVYYTLRAKKSKSTDFIARNSLTQIENKDNLLPQNDDVYDTSS